MSRFGHAQWRHLLAAISCLGFARTSLSATVPTSATDCCRTLSDTLPGKITYPGSTAYSDSVSSYWAQGEQLLNPSCVALPQTAKDVSSALKVLVGGACQFAVRSGGHGSVTGVANIENGVTMDLRGINTTTVSPDGCTVSVGAGQRLGNVYSLLHDRGLYVPTARASKIGAGGSTLGGGLGYIYPKTGFAADSVAEFEVVLADGRIATATKDVNSQLWRALKGGGSILGIVTKMVYHTFAQGDIWGGDMVWATSALDDVLQAFYDFVADPRYDENAAIMMSYHWAPADGNIINNQFVYAKPVVKPPVFSAFYPIKDQLADGTSVTNIPAMSAAQTARSPDGSQQITFAVTFRNSVGMLQDAFSLYNASIAEMTHIEGAALSLSLEPLVPLLAQKSKERGGNVMGVHPPPEGAILALLSLTFAHAADYAEMDRVSQKLLDGITGAAEKRGALEEFVDMNHAKGSQDVLRSYGADNFAFLQATARAYDPSGVFQRLMPGGFKL